MADYKNYAENLIGNWERDIYAPQAQVTKDVYQTNWNALTNNYNTLKDKLARNFDLAQKEYANTLNNVQNTSFNRMNSANIDLANRGLSGSGVLNRIEQADTQIKGQDIDKALADLLATNNASIEGSYQGLNALGQGQSKLASELAGDLGKLTDAEAANAQQYAGLLAGIGENAAQRAASRAGSGGGKTKEEEDLEEAYRKMGIAETLMDDTMDDDTKARTLAMVYDVPNAADAVKTYNNNNLVLNTQPKIAQLQDRYNDYSSANNVYNSLVNYLPKTALVERGLAKIYNPFSAGMYRTNKKLNKQQEKINGLTYQDMYDYLYNR